MDPNLTISALTFTQRYSDKEGSFREEISRGVSLPEKMFIKHQAYVDSATKRPGRQSALIFEYVGALADGTIAVLARATLKVQSLTDTNVSATIIGNVVERVVHTVQEDDTGLNLATNIYVNREQ
jgi:hypothetical protein